MEEAARAASQRSSSMSNSPKSGKPKFASAKSTSHKSASMKSEQPLPDIGKSEIPDPKATYPTTDNANNTRYDITNDFINPKTTPRPYSEAFSDTITVAATDFNLEDDDTTHRNSAINPDLKIKSSEIETPPAYEKLAQKNPKATDNLSITIGPPMIILFDIIIPCIIYYVWYDRHREQWINQCRDFENTNPNTPCNIPKPEYDRDVLGYAILSFGFGEVYILIARVWRLLKYRDLCAPLLSRSKWELDATSWVYGVAMICALIPFLVGSTFQIPQLYLYSPGF